jgi:thiol-disulfide isomerase/thioredoxin
MLMRRMLILSAIGIGLAANPHTNAVQTSQAPVSSGKVGSKLPELSLTDLRGHPVRSADLRGKVVLIDFWATWCGPCKKEMPGYQRLLERYGASGLVVIGLKFDTMRDTEDPLAFAKRFGVHYPLAVATDSVKQKFGGVEGLPTTLLYDRHGVLRDKVIGFEYTSVFEEKIKQLL